MPLHEVEKHPFLNYLEENKINWNKYTKLVVGTFPIYCITNSYHNGEPDRNIVKNWEKEAWFEFFYGSKKNRFWDLVNYSFDHPTPPKTKKGCIELLETNNIFITDVYSQCIRNGYSALDSALVKKSDNSLIPEYLMKGTHIRSIYFTSDDAKQNFCRIAGMEYRKVVLDERTYNSKKLTLVTLPSPARTDAQSLPGSELFNRWLYTTTTDTTDIKWQLYSSFKGKGKLKHFLELHNLPKNLVLTNQYKKDLYMLALNERYDELRKILNQKLP